jgi:spore coat assembly protein SafA
MNNKIHIVESGESLWKIAKHYGVDLSELIEANPQIEDPDKIYPGDGINIPGEEIAAIEEVRARKTHFKWERNWRPAQVILRGRISTFGGPDDKGVGPSEGLALVDEKNFELCKDLFLPGQPPETTGLARRLNPEKFYLACRWNFQETPKEVLAQAHIQVRNPLTDKVAYARPVDYGPALATGRVADLSPGLARQLDLATDDEVEVSFSPGALIITPEPVEETEVEISAAPTSVFSEAQIKKYFGSFSYREDYSQEGAWIIIDPVWKADHIIKVHIPCLEGIRTYDHMRSHGWLHCHKKIAADLQAAFAEIEQKGLRKYIIFWSGSLAPRHKNHDRNRGLSPHSWGIALDLNHHWNQYGDPPAESGTKGSVMELVPIFEKHGFYWGGNFSEPDGMHFEYAWVPTGKKRIISPSHETEIAKEEPMLAWGKKVSKEFRQKVREIADSLKTDPNYLMACIAFESGETFSPSIPNKAGSGAIGLIQFMPSTAQSLGTTSEELASMSAVEQLNYVEKYFKSSRGKLATLDDVYMAILWPAAVGKPLDYVLFEKDDPDHPRRYMLNAGLDFNKDGFVTKAEAADRVREALAKGKLPQFASA